MQEIFTNITTYHHWLVVEPTPLKNMRLSVGMSLPNYGKIKFMFQICSSHHGPGLVELQELFLWVSFSRSLARLLALQWLELELPELPS